MIDTSVARRDFVVGAAALGVTGAAAQTHLAWAEQASVTFADTVSWNAVYDVVVVGFGAAGGTAAVYAADGGAHVLLCDAAPEGEEGGNSRVACQMLCTGTDPDKTFSYYKDGLNWHFAVDDEVLRTFTDNLCNVKDLLVHLGADEESLFQWPSGTAVTPEYPEYGAGSDNIVETFVHQGSYDSAFYKLVRNAVLDRSDMIDIWYDAPAIHLVQDPWSKAVVGVEIAKHGETVRVRATRGVVMALGGFENNDEMKQDYLGAARMLPIGGLYNKGDGIRMAIEVGADLWHMEAYESLGILCGNGWANDDGTRIHMEPSHKSVKLISLGSEEFAQGSAMLVGDDGGRFCNEAEIHRHGHVYSNGVWRMPIANYTPHYVFDETQLQFLRDSGRMDEEREAALVSASTAEELAEKIGADPDILAQTIADFDFFVSAGRDYRCGRDPETMRAFDGGTLYAAELRPAILNTQGGPRRDKDARVLDTSGTPIPHLYAAGEYGGITAFQYNSGGNLAECLIFGMIAGQGAAAQTDDAVPMQAPVAAEDKIAYVAGSASDEGEEETYEVGEGQTIGSSTAGMGNVLTVRVTQTAGKITDVEILKESESFDYGKPALKTLVDEVVAAGTADVDIVAGATMTSGAFLEAVSKAVSA